MVKIIFLNGINSLNKCDMMSHTILYFNYINIILFLQFHSSNTNKYIPNRPFFHVNIETDKEIWKTELFDLFFLVKYLTFSLGMQLNVEIVEHLIKS